jgi:hypothetical protein
MPTKIKYTPVTVKLIKKEDPITSLPLSGVFAPAKFLTKAFNTNPIRSVSKMPYNAKNTIHEPNSDLSKKRARDANVNKPINAPTPFPIREEKLLLLITSVIARI